jgi:type IV secretion system protein VirD4
VSASSHTTAPLLAGPSPTVLWLLAGLALAATFTLLVSRRANRDRSYPARLARGRELAPLRVDRPERGRVTLGTHHGRILAAEGRCSVAVIGPSQSGKTSGLVIPAVLEWDGPVLATSVKSDVAADTYAARTTRGEVRVFDPSGLTLMPHAPWSPITASRGWQGARRTAARLLGLGEHAIARSADESFWRPASARYLAPLLLAAAHGDLTMREVLEWTNNCEQTEPAELLAGSRQPGARQALTALQSVWGADERFRSSLLQTVATSLDPWQEPHINAATINDSQISPGWLLDGPNTLYLISPADDQRRLRGLFCALLADILAGSFERSTETGRPLDPPLLLALDEAANIAPLPNLDEIASTGPGQGVQLLTVLQNLSQAADRWGTERAETILANHRARVYCSGIGDRATLEHLRATLGEQEIPRTSTSRQTPLATPSRTVTRELHPLAPAQLVRQTPPEKALLTYGHLPAAWIGLRPWYRDQQLTSLASGQSTHAPKARQARLGLPRLAMLRSLRSRSAR